MYTEEEMYTECTLNCTIRLCAFLFRSCKFLSRYVDCAYEIRVFIVSNSGARAELEARTQLGRSLQVRLLCR